jgi:hypothetical protein
MLTQILKYTLGILLAIAILIGGGIATALYFMNRVSITPPKPIFANDKPIAKVQVQQSPNPASNTTPNSSTEASLEESTSSTSNTTEISKKEESPVALPPGAYAARVTWQQGLTLRKEPTPEAESIGGVAYNQKVIILEENSDKTWQKIRLENSEQEGWVKAGNTLKIDAENDYQSTEQPEQQQ